MRKRLFALALSLLSAVAVTCPGTQAIDLDEFAKQPGVEVTTRMIGDKKVTSYRKAGVVFEKWPDYVVSIDQTEFGAVMCTWSFYVDFMLSADACFPDSRVELKAHLAYAVNAMNDFIVANSLDPVKKADLEDYIAKRRRENFSHTPSRLIGTPQCHLSALLMGFEKTTPEEWRAAIDKLLSVPRPPVMNPCT